MGKPRKLVKSDSKEDITGPEPEKINLDDQMAIKNKLDCAVVDVSGPCTPPNALTPIPSRWPSADRRIERHPSRPAPGASLSIPTDA